MTEAEKLALKTDADLTRFVSDLYRIFLGREPDPGGWAHYVEQLRGGTAISDIVAVFAGSDEYRERKRREVLTESGLVPVESDAFPADYKPPGEAGRSYLDRLRSGFLHRYCSGPLVLDVGYAGHDNPDRKTALPHAIGVDLEFPGYDGIRLPFDDGVVDTVFSSHCLEHITFDLAVIRDWYRVLRVGGFIVCMVPSQALYEKRRFLPSRFNADHKRMYTPASLAGAFEAALEVNSYRVRHLAENDRGFNYALGPETHPEGACEIEIVIEKIKPPSWRLA